MIFEWEKKTKKDIVSLILLVLLCSVFSIFLFLERERERKDKRERYSKRMREKEGREVIKCTSRGKMYKSEEKVIGGGAKGVFAAGKLCSESRTNLTAKRDNSSDTKLERDRDRDRDTGETDTVR